MVSNTMIIKDLGIIKDPGIFLPSAHRTSPVAPPLVIAEDGPWEQRNATQRGAVHYDPPCRVMLPRRKCFLSSAPLGPGNSISISDKQRANRD